tara:strand:+ start:286 stop:627 length:342 start_codon:yes stop_codon:yes gene_type:complete
MRSELKTRVSLASNLIWYKIYMSYIFNPSQYVLITDDNHNIDLPDTAKNTTSILVVNVSSTDASLTSTSSNIYNNLYARKGVSEIYVAPNRMMFLIYFQNFKKDAGKWLCHVG